jgi:hypothetical protein
MIAAVPLLFAITLDDPPMQDILASNEALNRQERHGQRGEQQNKKQRCHFFVFTPISNRKASSSSMLYVVA